MAEMSKFNSMLKNEKENKKSAKVEKLKLKKRKQPDAE